MTNIYQAALDGDITTLRYLLETGANPNDRGFLGLGNPPLYAAAFNGHEEAVRLLLEHGADPLLSRNILSLALDNGHYTTALLLLGSGAATDFPKHSSNATFYTNEYVDNGKAHEIPHLDKRNFYSQTLMHIAAQEGDVNKIYAFVKEGADVNVGAFGNITPLHEAVERGKLQAAEALLKNGADVNATTDLDVTPLHRAAILGNKDMCDLLLAWGADPNAVTAFGETPVHWAAEHGGLEAIEKIKIWGGNIDLADEQGYTPLQDAICWKQKAVVNFLVSHGADIHHVAKDGLSVTDLARVSGDKEILFSVQNDEPILISKSIITQEEHLMSQSIDKFDYSMRTRDEKIKDDLKDLGHDTKEKAKETRDKIEDKAGDLKKDAERKWEDLKDDAKHENERLKDTVEDIKDDVKQHYGKFLLDSLVEFGEQPGYERSLEEYSHCKLHSSIEVEGAAWEGYVGNFSDINVVLPQAMVAVEGGEVI